MTGSDSREVRVVLAPNHAARALWPWDADRDDPLYMRRIPVTGPVPDWHYAMTFDRTSPERPDEAETAVLASYVKYSREHRLTAWDRKQYGDRAFDMGFDVVTVVVHKRGPGSWSYRVVSGGLDDSASHWWPPIGQAETLTSVLDRHENGGRAWLAWKAVHPDVFTSPASEGPDA